MLTFRVEAMPRYLPVQLDAANKEIREVYSSLEEQLGFVPNFIKTLAHSGNFLEALATFYQRITGETGLSEKIRQLAILKTCKLHKCRYTVAYHAELARKSGWSDEQIESMDDYSSSDLFSYYEKEVLQLAEQVSAEPEEIQDDFWTQLDNHFTSDQVVELITLIAFFNFLNRLIQALQIEPDSVPELTQTRQTD